MARKPNKFKAAGPTPAQLRGRIQVALREHRLPQALELARQLSTHEPTEANRQLLRDTYREAIRYQVNREAWMEARQLLDQAEKVDGPPTWWETLALLRAKVGDSTIARQLLEKVPGTALLPRILGHVVDRALRDVRNGKLKLSADLHAGFDLVVTAFAQYEKGEDEAAKQTLQGIGLQSPYLDWKLLLRGLMAHAANDDSRALDNWQRLDPERLPAKMAAPFRYNLDTTFRNSLDAERARTIGRRADQMSHPMLSSLRDLQRTLGSAENLPQALRQAPSVLAMLKMNFPQHVPKLANCFYWLIIQGGQPEDLDRYERIFGPPPDDKEFLRLQAQVMESYPRLEDAHRCWKDYLEEIAHSPERWPGEFGKRARATILMRMGDNALEHLQSEDEPSFDDFFSMLSPRRRPKTKRKPLVPSAETCFRQSMELAPGWKEPGLRLMNLLQDEEKWSQAETVGKTLLERFPDDVNILMIVSNVQHALGKTAEAVELMKRALKNNPLDRTLRAGVGVFTLQQGRFKTAAGEFEDARLAFREAIDLDPVICGTIGRAAWAACEYKAGDKEKGDALVAELAAKPEERIASTYYLAVEGSRAKVAKPLLKELQTRFEEALSGKPTVPELNALARALGFYRQETPAYRGIGTHEKKIHALFLEAVNAQPPEEEMIQLGFALLKNKIHKVLKTCAEQGERRFPNNPIFVYLLGEQAILQKPKSFNVRTVGRLFHSVMRQTEGKNDDRSRMMRDSIEERLKEHPDLEMWVHPSRMRDFFPW